MGRHSSIASSLSAAAEWANACRHVQSVVEETLELLAASLPAQVRLEKHLHAADTAVVGDATQLHQVTMNLCTNAMQAMDRGGVLTVGLERVEVGERRLLSNGTLGDGTGLGLALVNNIFSDLRGAIDVATQINVGTTFTVWLPVATETPVLQADPAGEVPRATARR